MSPLPCDEQIKALHLCEKRHPREKDIVCKTLNASLAWCLLKLRCRTEAEDLEDCCGMKSGSKSGGPPTAVPRRCHGAAARLEACLERATEEGDEKERR